MDSDIFLAVSTRMPCCPILPFEASCHTKGCDSLSLSKGRYDETFTGEDAFEDDSTYKHTKDKSDCNSFLLPVLSKYNG